MALILHRVTLKEMQKIKRCKMSVTGLLQALAIGKNIHFLLFARLLQWFEYS